MVVKFLTTICPHKITFGVAVLLLNLVIVMQTFERSTCNLRRCVHSAPCRNETTKRTTITLKKFCSLLDAHFSCELFLFVHPRVWYGLLCRSVSCNLEKNVNCDDRSIISPPARTEWCTQTVLLQCGSHDNENLSQLLKGVVYHLCYCAKHV